MSPPSSAMSSTSFARGVPLASSSHTRWAIWISAAPLVLVGTPAAVSAARYAIPLSEGRGGAGTEVVGTPGTGGCAVGVPAAGGATVPDPVDEDDEGGTAPDDADALADGDEDDEDGGCEVELDGALENGADPDEHPATTTTSATTIPTTCLKPCPLSTARTTPSAP